MICNLNIIVFTKKYCLMSVRPVRPKIAHRLEKIRRISEFSTRLLACMTDNTNLIEFIFPLQLLIHWAIREHYPHFTHLQIAQASP